MKRQLPEAPEKQKRQRIYTDEEMSLIANTFKDNEPLLKALRKFMLQMPLEPGDQVMIDNLKLNKPLVALLRKVFLPTLDPDAPIHQLIDLWMTVSIVEKTPEEAEPHLLARQTLIDYLDQQLIYLEGGENTKDKIEFGALLPSKMSSPPSNYSNLLARNTAISHTEMQLNVLTVLSTQDETPEQAVTRLRKNSSK